MSGKAFTNTCHGLRQLRGPGLGLGVKVMVGRGVVVDVGSDVGVRVGPPGVSVGPGSGVSVVAGWLAVTAGLGVSGGEVGVPGPGVSVTVGSFGVMVGPAVLEGTGVMEPGGKGGKVAVISTVGSSVGRSSAGSSAHRAAALGRASETGRPAAPVRVVPSIKPMPNRHRRALAHNARRSLSIHSPPPPLTPTARERPPQNTAHCRNDWPLLAYHKRTSVDWA